MDRRSVVLWIAVAYLTGTTWVAQVWGADCGEPAAAPKYLAGEKWTWRDEKGREGTSIVLQVEGDIAQIRLLSGDVASYDGDWVIQKIVRTTGEVVTSQGAGATATVRVGQRSLDFPLQVGKQWEIGAVAQSRTGTTGLERYYERSKVLACEEVKTPAGVFPAFKVEVERGMTGVQPRGGAPKSGTYYLWYAPQAKNIVRLQYTASQWWSGGRFLNNELIKFEGR